MDKIAKVQICHRFGAVQMGNCTISPIFLPEQLRSPRMQNGKRRADRTIFVKKLKIITFILLLHISG